MAIFIADASVTLPWCFEDEATAWTDGLLDRLRAGDRIMVPAHWPTEVSNGLLVALRRKRIQPGRPELFWDALATLPIEVEPSLSPLQAKAVLALCARYGLTVYDATYLELAKRKGLPLATLDADLISAASAEGVPLIT
ncbi:MAG: type II toxin-antitoxin system VapC family toxin [Candidatus Korobacteraceae bacterium]|jgi:predicted nucleic acid-binding protein